MSITYMLNTVKNEERMMMKCENIQGLLGLYLLNVNNIVLN